MASRVGFRFVTHSSRNSVFRSPFNTRQNVFRRYQSTVAPDAPQQSVFQRMWTSEVGLKTVHFWAPVMKWGVVLAGASDFLRPASKLSVTQNLALVATGSIWTRWCFVIRPQNMLLAAVNFCLFCVGTIQVSRIVSYNAEQEGSTSAAISKLWGEVKGSSKEAAKTAEQDVKKGAGKAEELAT